MTMDILEKLKILESESRKLDPEPMLRNHWRKSVSDYSDSFHAYPRCQQFRNNTKT